MNRILLELHGQRTAYAPGETIAGLVSWEFEKAPGKIEVRLAYHTEGKGTRDHKVVQTVVFDDPPAQDSQIFQFTAPAGPHSFSGKLISLVWAVEAQTGGWLGKTTAEAELTIAPGGREIPLPEAVTG